MPKLDTGDLRSFRQHDNSHSSVAEILTQAYLLLINAIFTHFSVCLDAERPFETLLCEKKKKEKTLFSNLVQRLICDGPSHNLTGLCVYWMKKARRTLIRSKTQLFVCGSFQASALHPLKL